MTDPAKLRLGDSQTFRPQQPDPRSLYLHIPFCRHRCGYCNFALVANRDYLVERYLNAVETEISWLDSSFEVDTIFLGGGTPSHLTPKQIDRLNSIIKSRFRLVDNREITAECNPNDLDKDRMAALARLGVNRISLGVQSLNSKKLKRLERGHSPEDVKHAVEVAKRFSVQVSIDLIFAAPQETLLQWDTDLDVVLALEPDHMSTYELTYEKGTRFWNRLNRGDISEANEDLRGEMYTLAIEKLRQHDLDQYEISSFARDGHQCRHNLVYWRGDPYFAFGPGAARFIDGIRETNHQSTMQYLKCVEDDRSPVSARERLDPASAARERLAIGLRMVAGLGESEFTVRTGTSISEVLGPLAEQLKAQELLIQCGSNWRLTPRGRMVCDWVASKILRYEQWD